jgi:glutathione S-transferase
MVPDSPQRAVVISTRLIGRIAPCHNGKRSGARGIFKDEIFKDMTLKLFIGNKNYSSWSMRPWLVLKAFDIPFDETLIPIYRDAADKQRILDVTPSGKVPALVDDDITIWDSLAIIEYLAERFPDAAIWPKERAARAYARAISAEMHGGFGPLRRECGMNIHRPVRAKVLSKTLSADALADIARIQEMWIDCRQRHAALGPYLFGAFSAADAMYAPVVHRFLTYAVEVEPQARAYMDAMLVHPAFAQWTREAMAEVLVIEKFEAD